MINKLPKWVEVGGFFLTVIAGSVNAIGLLGFRHEAVSHLTGVSTLLGLELAQSDFSQVMHLFLIMLGFVLGAAYSSFIVGSASLQLGRRYGIALSSEAILLLSSLIFLNAESNIGHIFASAACGLQNAMTTTYSGAIVRTTHVTGLFTDLGITLGLKLRGHPADYRKILLYLILISGFILGGMAGAVCFERYRFFSMLLPAGLAALMAGIYWIYLFAKFRSNRKRRVG